MVKQLLNGNGRLRVLHLAIYSVALAGATAGATWTLGLNVVGGEQHNAAQDERIAAQVESVADLKDDIGQLQSSMRRGFRDVNERLSGIDRRLSRLEGRAWRSRPPFESP